MNLSRRVKHFSLALLLFGSGLMALAQGKAVTINVKNASLKQVFSIIERRTDYRISYRNALIDDRKDITLNLSGASVQQILTEALRNRNLEFTVIPPSTIVIADRGKAPEPTDRKKESGKGKPENHRPASGTCPCRQRD